MVPALTSTDAWMASAKRFTRHKGVGVSRGTGGPKVSPLTVPGPIAPTAAQDPACTSHCVNARSSRAPLGNGKSCPMPFQPTSRSEPVLVTSSATPRGSGAVVLVGPVVVVLVVVVVVPGGCSHSQLGLHASPPAQVPAPSHCSWLPGSTTPSPH